jgi:hypothetical protein
MLIHALIHYAKIIIIKQNIMDLNFMCFYLTYTELYTVYLLLPKPKPHTSNKQFSLLDECYLMCLL